MNLSVVIPAHNEEEGVRRTVERLYGTLMDAGIPFEILVINDHSTDATESVLQALAREMPGVRSVNNQKPAGFGFAIQTGLERFRGDAVCIVMADSSDDPQDVVTYYRKLEEGYECVFGSRFVRGGRVVDYPTHKLLINRLANAFINTLFQLGFNDITNAFKAYRREVIEGVKPFLSSHFNITVELPLKAIARGYTYTTVPINWYNRATGVSKLKIKEMGSRYLFIVLYVWLERLLSRGDYRRATPLGAGQAQATLGPGSAAHGATAANSAANGANGLYAHLATLDEGVEEIGPTLPRVRRISTQTLGEVGAGEPVVAVATRGAAAIEQPATRLAPGASLDSTDGADGMDGMVGAPPTRETPPPSPLAQRSGPLLAMVAGIVAIVPVLLVTFLLYMIWTHTPHVPYWDEWETVTLMQHFSQGTLSWNDFWAFHNEHRIVIPQMIEFGLILLTHWNRQVEMSFDLLLGVAEWALLMICAYRGLRSKTLTILAIIPISLAIFSFAQYEDWLWSFQITFFCTTLGVALCLWGLTAPRPTWRAFVISLLGAVLAALSSLGGLVAFVAFIPMVLSLGYKKTIAWVVVALAVIIPYMQGFPHTVPIKITLTTLEFCVTYLGAPAGTISTKLAFGAGAVSIALAIANVVYYWAREKRIAPLLPWIGLGGYAMGVALITSFGRIVPGVGMLIALTSRYQIFSALWWTAVIYLLLLNTRSAWARTLNAGADTHLLTRVSPWIISANTLMLLLATLGLAWSSVQSVPNMATFQNVLLQSEGCVVNADYAPTPCLWRFYPGPTVIQERVAYLRAHHYAIFGENYQALEQPAPNPSAHALVRYFDVSIGDYWVTSSYDVSFYGDYPAATTLGYVYDQQQPGTHALYTCVTSAGHHFVSLKVSCAGGAYQRTEGWLLIKPAIGTSVVALYDCSAHGADFVWPAASCDGQAPKGILGYALAKLP